MAESNGSTAERIELTDGHWANVRMEPAITGADLRAQQLTRIQDGRTEYDLFLDTMATFKTRIVEWSRGPVDAKNIDNLPGEDVVALVRFMAGIVEKGIDELPPLETSSAGTETKGRRRNRGSGASGE